MTGSRLERVRIGIGIVCLGFAVVEFITGPSYFGVFWLLVGVMLIVYALI